MKAAMKQQPVLDLCHTPGCGDTCPRFHGPVDEDLERVVLDLWGRSWTGRQSDRATPGQATAWHALLRVPAVAQSALLGCSGSSACTSTQGIRPADPHARLMESFGYPI